MLLILVKPAIADKARIVYLPRYVEFDFKYSFLCRLRTYDVQYCKSWHLIKDFVI